MKKLYFAMLCLLLASCTGKKSEPAADRCGLEATGKVKSFELDIDVKYNPFYLYTFAEKNGKEYLSFLNYRANQLHFYDLGTTDFLFKVNLETEGPNGVGIASGYYIKDFDNMYVSNYAYPGLIRIDTTGHIVQKIPYGKTKKGYQILPSYTPSSHPYNAPVILGDKIYITQRALPNFHSVDETPISVAIDTVQQSCEEVPPTFSVLTEAERSSETGQFSRIFDGERFIYSFYVSEDVIVAPLDGTEHKRIKAKSQYIDDPSMPQKEKDMVNGPRLYLEIPRYGDLIYDPYREVYYHFAYPEVSLDKNTRWVGRAVYGRKKFSVIILDKEFNMLGETLFPEEIYNPFACFVHKDGLYISRDYQIGTGEQSEDYMTFELFKLTGK